MSRVDAHHHIWDLSVREQAGWPGRRWIRSGATSRSTTSRHTPRPPASPRPCMVQTVSLVDETVEFLEVAASNDFVAGVVGWVDLTAPDVADVLAGLLARPDGSYLKGIRHQVHDEPDTDWLLRPDVQRGLAAVADAGLVVRPPDQNPTPPGRDRDCPQPSRSLTFVVDHISKPVIGEPLEPWATQLRELATLPNVTCKLSGMVTEAYWTDWKPSRPPAVRRRGPGRLHPRPSHVRLRLARLPPGRPLPRRRTNRRNPDHRPDPHRTQRNLHHHRHPHLQPLSPSVVLA